MASAQLDAAIAELPEADRRVFVAVLEVVETILSQLERLADGLAALNALDDIRAKQIAALQATIAGEPALHSINADLLASRQGYWDELAKLRAEREHLEREQGEAPLVDLGQAEFETRAPSASGRTILADEIVPDEHGNTHITFGDGTGAVHTASGWYEVWEEANPGA